MLNHGPLVDVLANWLWQGSSMALAATALLRVSPRLSATMRYQLWWVALSAVLVMPLLPWLLQGPESGAGLAGAVHVEGQGAGGALPKTSLGVVLPTLPPWALALLVMSWGGWAMVSLSRTVLALGALRDAKLAARPFPPGREARLETWRSLRAHGRRAELGVSDSVRAAAVLGLTSPAIVVAPSALAALDDEELDQIVVHEWAHVQRRDDCACLVQRVVVAFAGLHPAVWWINRQLNLERETACDDWAVNATGSARGLATSLTKLAAMPGRPADAVLLPAAFLSSELTTRVIRLLDRGRNTSTTRAASVSMLVAPVLTAMALAVASVELVVTSPMVPDVRQAASAAVPAVGPAALDRAGLGPDPVQVPRPAAPARRVASRPTRAQAPATSARDASALPGPLERTGVALPSHVPPHTPRPEVVLPAELPTVEATLEADLPGSRIAPVAVVDGLPATSAPSPWGAAADAGVTVGKGTQRAAVATAGFFTKLSKSISGVF